MGDVLFQQKCFEWPCEIHNRGCTILLVSHDMEAINLLCDGAIPLHEGKWPRRETRARSCTTTSRGRDTRRCVGDVTDAPDGEGYAVARRALAELLEHHGWFDKYDACRFDHLIGVSGPAPVEDDFYRYDGVWRRLPSVRGLGEWRCGERAVVVSAVACQALRRSRNASRPARLGALSQLGRAERLAAEP